MLPPFLFKEVMGQKEQIFKELRASIISLIENENNLIANLANITALLKDKLDHFWIGFYLVDSKEQQLVLGPFQGPLACTRIPFGKGVCGVCWQTQQTQVVPNVHDFPGHIACSSKSNSEIVVPILKDGKVLAVLDIDSTEYEMFDDQDKVGLESIAEIIADLQWQM